MATVQILFLGIPRFEQVWHRSLVSKKKKETSVYRTVCQIRSLLAKKKKRTAARLVAQGRRPSGPWCPARPLPSFGCCPPGRLGAEDVWGPAPVASARLATARRTSGVRHQIGPLLFRPKFELKKSKKKNWGRTKLQYTSHHKYIKKETNYFVHFASPSRCRAFPASYISAATRFLSISLPRQRVTTVST
jgi:hypothetical protein